MTPTVHANPPISVIRSEDRAECLPEAKDANHRPNTIQATRQRHSHKHPKKSPDKTDNKTAAAKRCTGRCEYLHKTTANISTNPSPPFQLYLVTPCTRECRNWPSIHENSFDLKSAGIKRCISQSRSPQSIPSAADDEIV